MDRRRYLALLGGVLTAGCLSADGPPDSRRSETPTPVPTTTTDPEPSTTLPSFNPSSTHEMVGIGSRENVSNPEFNVTNTVGVWNAADSTRRIGVEIHAGEESVLDTAYDVPTDATVDIELREPDDYTIDMRVPADDGAESFTVPREKFDCNTRIHQTTVHPDGRIHVVEVATTMACMTPTTTS